MTREEFAKELRCIDPDTKYYAITLLGTADGKMQWSAYTHWVGWVDGKPGREIRQASLVNAERMAYFWTEMGEGYLVVNSTSALLVYTRLGGNALVAKEIGDKYFADEIGANETAYDGAMGFKAASDLPPHVFKRAPRPKHRMKIIQRDRYRCRICGRRPDDYTDIELHVHHIRPWEKGGLTEDENLLTLCDTCHDGLQPHDEPSLFELLDPNAFLPDLASKTEKYHEGVRLYRKISKVWFSQLDSSVHDSDHDIND
jgi:hypothetical protein